MEAPLTALVFTLSAFVAFTVAVTGLRRRRVTPAVSAVAVLAAAVGTWSMADGLLLLDAGLENVQPLLALKFVAIGVMPAGFYCLSLAVTDRAWRPARDLLPWLAVEPVLTVVALLTNPRHHGFISALDPDNLWGPAEWVPGPLFWAHTAYSYTLIAVGIGRLVRAWLRGPRAQRGLYGSTLLGVLPPLVLNAVSLVGIVRVDYLTPVGFCVTAVVFYWTLVRRSLHELVPVERARLFDMIGDMVMTVDAAGRILDLNPAAERVLRRIVPDAPVRLTGLPVLDVFGGVLLADRAEPGAVPPADGAGGGEAGGGGGGVMTVADRRVERTGAAAVGPDAAAASPPVDEGGRDYTLVAPDGRTVELDVRVSALRDSRQTTIGWA
ncbi:histidine kinase N-terminal 7TM domain-containing protein, partial [Planomonospora alba]|uniref:histidine kinase N-terminal 7TM domain-containing protein n=1 Tax=Planomonospora alba TaxID=161354 RepID=UPI0031EEACAA